MTQQKPPFKVPPQNFWDGNQFVVPGYTPGYDLPPPAAPMETQSSGLPQGFPIFPTILPPILPPVLSPSPMRRTRGGGGYSKLGILSRTLVR